MDEYKIKSATLTAIGDSIRAKTGTTDKITPTDMPAAIDSITGGGGGSADVRYVTFTNASTGETFVKPVAVGDDCVDVVAKGLWAKPTQESTAQYDYAFANGWSATPGGTADANILKNITEDKTVYAVFTATVRKYTITWLDSDGVTELPGQKQWAYGTVPSYTPTKEGDTFEKWNPTPVAVTGDASYVAKWAGEIGGELNDGAIKWSIANDTLTFTGVGEIPHQSRSSKKVGTVTYVYGTAPWLSYKDKFSNVVVGEGITRLGAYLLHGQTSASSAYNIPLEITSISLPSTLTGAWYTDAFTGSVVDTISLAEGITTVGGMGVVKNVVLPQSVTNIADNAFYNSTRLTSIIIPRNVTSIGKNAFYNSAITSATFENTEGWWVTTTAGATSGTSITVSGNMYYSLKTTYVAHYWHRT